MKTQCTVCFKHLKRNCKCGSLNNQFPVGWKFKVPKKNKVDSWKETLEFLVKFHQSRTGTEQLESAVNKTRLQSHFYNLKQRALVNE